MTEHRLSTAGSARGEPRPACAANASAALPNVRPKPQPDYRQTALKGRGQDLLGRYFPAFRCAAGPAGTACVAVVKIVTNAKIRRLSGSFVTIFTTAKSTLVTKFTTFCGALHACEGMYKDFYHLRTPARRVQGSAGKFLYKRSSQVRPALISRSSGPVSAACKQVRS